MVLWIYYCRKLSGKCSGVNNKGLCKEKTNTAVVSVWEVHVYQKVKVGVGCDNDWQSMSPLRLSEQAVSNCRCKDMCVCCLMSLFVLVTSASAIPVQVGRNSCVSDALHLFGMCNSAGGTCQMSKSCALILLA